MALTNFEKGRRWSYSVFRRNVNEFGELGVRKSDKACFTCGKIVKTQKRQGKRITKNQRDFYKGAVNGFMEFYNKEIIGPESKSRK